MNQFLPELSGKPSFLQERQDKLFDAYGRETVCALIQRQPAVRICSGSDSGLLFLLKTPYLP